MVFKHISTYRWNLIATIIRYQVLGAMEMKLYSAQTRAIKLEPHHQMQFRVIFRTLFFLRLEILPNVGDIVCTLFPARRAENIET